LIVGRHLILIPDAGFVDFLDLNGHRGRTKVGGSSTYKLQPVFDLRFPIEIIGSDLRCFVGGITSGTRIIQVNSTAIVVDGVANACATQDAGDREGAAVITPVEFVGTAT